MSIEELIALCHHRWSAPVLAELGRTRGARFVVLVNRLGVGRASLQRTLAALVELGLVRRNPGYGHPLRPEYLLTPEGEEAAVRCARLLAAAVDGKADVLLRKWSLPVLFALRGNTRFSELREALPGITARALALALKDLERAELVTRRVEETYPPSTVYAATAEAARLQRILA
ncbi:MAG: winged helix-turn-helix transcriptional regulator [Gaiellaceae bacterium]